MTNWIISRTSQMIRNHYENYLDIRNHKLGESSVELCCRFCRQSLIQHVIDNYMMIILPHSI